MFSPINSCISFDVTGFIISCCKPNIAVHAQNPARLWLETKEIEQDTHTIVYQMNLSTTLALVHRTCKRFGGDLPPVTMRNNGIVSTATTCHMHVNLHCIEPNAKSWMQVSPNRSHTGSHEPKKPASSVGIKNYRHGLGLGTGPVRVPGGTGSTGNRPNRSGSQRFGEPCMDACMHAWAYIADRAGTIGAKPRRSFFDLHHLGWAGRDRSTTLLTRGWRDGMGSIGSTCSGTTRTN
jgi:hypothetical protein